MLLLFLFSFSCNIFAMEEAPHYSLPSKNIDLPRALTRMAISTPFLAGLHEREDAHDVYLYNRATRHLQLLDKGLMPAATPLIFNKSASLVHYGMQKSGHIISWNTQTRKESTLYNPYRANYPMEFLCFRNRFNLSDIKQPCTALACNANAENELFAGYAHDSNVILWDVENEKKIAEQRKDFSPHYLHYNAACQVLAIVSENDRHYSSSPNGLYFWDIRAKNCKLKSIDGWTNSTLNIFSWNPENPNQFAVQRNDVIIINDLRSDKALATIDEQSVDWFTFLNDKNLLLKKYFSKMFLLYDIATQKKQLVGNPNNDITKHIQYDHAARELIAPSFFPATRYIAYDTCLIAPRANPAHTEIMPLLGPLPENIKTYYIYYADTLSPIKSLQSALKKYIELECDALKKDIIATYHPLLEETLQTLINRVELVIDARSLIALCNKETIAEEFIKDLDECCICFEIYPHIYTKSAAGKYQLFTCTHHFCSLCTKNFADCPLCREKLVLADSQIN